MLTYFFLASVLFLILGTVCLLKNQLQSQSQSGKLSSTFQNRFIFALLVLLCGVSLGIYSLLGSINQLDLSKTEEQQLYIDFSKALGSLENQINQEPNNPFSWYLLADGYFKLNRIDLAEKFIIQAYQLDRQDEQIEYGEILLLYAKILGVKQGDFKDGFRFSLLERANLRLAEQVQNRETLNELQTTKIQSQWVEAKWLLGYAHFNNQNPQMAIATWQDLKTLELPENQRQMIEQAINQAQIYQQNQFTLPLQIEITPELYKQIQANAILFVVLRAGDSIAMPLAAKRIENLTFPKTLEMNQDDLLAATRNTSIDQNQSFEIQAFIAQNGTANLSQNDLLSDRISIPNLGDEVRLIINQIQP